MGRYLAMEGVFARPWKGQWRELGMVSETSSCVAVGFSRDWQG